MKDVCSAMLSLYTTTEARFPWGGYLCSEDSAPDLFIGSCAFKSNPVNKRVEIAYFSFPGFEGRGNATRMVRQLIEIATSVDGDILVFAQTLPQENASNHLLRKCGFRFVGEVMHPEDGLVWEWEWNRKGREAGAEALS